MTFIDFSQLPDSEKIAYLYNHGVYIGKQKINNTITILYQLQHFYVEISFASYRRKISSLAATEDMEILTPYLNQIDVKELIAAYE